MSRSVTTARCRIPRAVLVKDLTGLEFVRRTAATQPTAYRTCPRSGFTLIESSIVLVIIDLVIGGVLVGRDLIEAARIRSFVTQLEKCYQAVNNTIILKYNGIPGDLEANQAAQFRFVNCSGLEGHGDGNGRISCDSDVDSNSCNGGGEYLDLAAAHLVDAPSERPDR